MRSLTVLLLVSAAVTDDLLDADKKHHHKHKHHNAVSVAPEKAPGGFGANATSLAVAGKGQAPEEEAKAPAKDAGTEAEIVEKMKAIEQKIDAREAKKASAGVHQGRIIVNGPLPTDFSTVFVKAVAAATGCDANAVKIIATHSVADADSGAADAALLQLPANSTEAKAIVLLAMGSGEVEVVFEGPADVVQQVEQQAADENSKLVNGPLNKFLTADDAPAEAPAEEPAAAAPAAGLAVDTDMPFGELEPFGREDTAQELTDSSIRESDKMVDQLERAEVAEEKRSVFRAITRLRGAAITSFDGIARAQTGNIDEYNHNHQWRNAHPLHHLADEEADVSKWAFPNNAD